jgi:hypothetical protein
VIINEFVKVIISTLFWFSVLILSHPFIHIKYHFQNVLRVPTPPVTLGQMAHNVPAVGEVLGARMGKRKGNPFHTPLRFQGT